MEIDRNPEQRTANNLENDFSKPICLFHLKKTAGTSLYQMLSTRFDNNEVLEWNNHFYLNKENIKLCGGHYEIEDAVKINSNLVTFLRNPIDRIISRYNYANSHDTRELISAIDPDDLVISKYNFSEFAKSSSDSMLIHNCNYFCKSIFGIDYSGADIFMSDYDLTNYASRIIDKFYFIGFVENFELDVKRLFNNLGLCEPVVLKHEKKIDDLYQTPSIRSWDDVDNNTLEYLRLSNHDDFRLVQILKQRAFAPKSLQYPRFRLDQQLRSFNPGDYVKVSYSNRAMCDFFLYSWHYLEPDGIWSSSRRCALAFKLSGPVTRIEFDLELPPLIGRTFCIISLRSDSGISLTTLVMSQEAKDVSFRAHGLTNVVILSSSNTFIIKADVSQLPRETPIQIVIETDYSIVPGDVLPNNGDERLIGIKLKSVTCS